MMTYWHSFYTFTRNVTLANCTGLKLGSCYENFYKNSRNFINDWCNTSSSGKVALESRLRALKMRYTLMDSYLVDIHLVLEAFGGIRIWNLEMKPTDGGMIFTYLGKRCETSNRLVTSESPKWIVTTVYIIYCVYYPFRWLRHYLA